MSDALAGLIPFLLRVFEVALGIGLVIFVHELGHFLVAKKVGIRVETFSLGFGPRLFGFRRGDTDYRISAIPLGGYVKMAGESPDEARSGAPGDFSAKGVGARAAVISAGVIMNTIFAVIFFLVAFKIGVQMHVPVVGEVMPDSPAAQAGLQRGDRIVSIDGERPLDFVDVGLAAAFADERGLELRVERRGALLPPIHVEPRRDFGKDYQQLGIAPIDAVAAVAPGSAAEKSGLRPGDWILTLGGKPLPSRGALEDAIFTHPGEPLAVEVEREGKIVPLTLVPAKEPARTYGMTLSERPVIRGVVQGQPAEAAGLAAGDIVLAVDGERPDGVEGLRAKIASAPRGAPIKLELERGGKPLAVEVTPVFDAASGRQVVGISLGATSVVASVAPGSPAAQAGVEAGMRIVSIDGQQGSIAPDRLDAHASRKGGEKTTFVFEAPGGAKRTIALAGAVVPERFVGELDFTSGPAEFTHRVPGVIEPIKLGFERTWMFIEQVGLTIRGMFAQRIDTSTLGGPIAIGKGAYDVAARGVGTLFYFLAVISVNLAVLNLLPIPVLDGGHLAFLAIEKAKGSPVSPSVQAAAQWAGLAALLALMVFVTKNDIARLLGG